MGLSPARFNSFFLENSAGVMARMASLAGAERAAALSDAVFRDARAVMDTVPADRLDERACSVILAGAESRAAAGLNGTQPVQARVAPEYAPEQPEAVPEQAAAEPPREQSEPRPEPAASEQPQAAPAAPVYAAQQEMPPQPPAGWMRRVGGDEGVPELRHDYEEPPFTPEQANAGPQPAPWQPPLNVSQEVPAGQSQEQLRAQLADKVEERGGRIWPKVVLLVVLIVLVLVLLWAMAGVLMSQGVIPALPLGYSWFNRVFFPFF